MKKNSIRKLLYLQPLILGHPQQIPSVVVQLLQTSKQ